VFFCLSQGGVLNNISNSPFKNKKKELPLVKGGEGGLKKRGDE